MLIVPPPERLIPFPLQGPISERRTVMFVEFVIVRQSPFGLVMWRLSMTVPFCPLIFTGPDGVWAADSRAIENITNKRLSTILNARSWVRSAGLVTGGLPKSIPAWRVSPYFFGGASCAP